MCDIETDCVYITRTFKKFDNDDNILKDKQASLSSLSKFSQAGSETDCATLLETIFNFAKKKMKFTDNEKKKIGTLIKKRLEDILNFLFDFAVDFDPTKEISLFEYRSALHVILEDYKDFPTDVSGERLQKSLNEILLDDDTVSEMDEAVKVWRSYVVSESQKYSVNDLRRPSGISDKHSWWF